MRAAFSTIEGSQVDAKAKGTGNVVRKTVDYIQSKQQRNVQPGFFHRDVLVLVRRAHTIQIEK